MKGNCEHGQIFVPADNLCRNIFCPDGFYLDNNLCESNTTYQKNNQTNHEMKIELDFNIMLCSTAKSSAYDECDQNLKILNQTVNYKNILRNSLAKTINITSKRFSDFKIMEIKYLNRTSKNNSFSINKFLTHKVSFTLLNKDGFENETKDNRVVFFNLVQFSLLTNEFLAKDLVFDYFNVTFISNVVEIKKIVKSKWCGRKYDKIERYDYPNFKILVLPKEKDMNMVYFVYVNNKFYKRGEYVMALIGMLGLNHEEVINETNFNVSYSWSKNDSFLDLTNIFVGTNPEQGIKYFIILNIFKIFYYSKYFLSLRVTFIKKPPMK